MEQVYVELWRNLIVDDPEVYHGGPVGLQLVGRRLREEDVLEMAEILESALKTA